MVAHFLSVILIAVALLVFLIVKLKVHPTIALFISGMFTGLGLGYDLSTTMNSFTQGFGSTLGGIGLTIIFGSIIAQGIRDSNSL